MPKSKARRIRRKLQQQTAQTLRQTHENPQKPIEPLYHQQRCLPAAAEPLINCHKRSTMPVQSRSMSTPKMAALAAIPVRVPPILPDRPKLKKPFPPSFRWDYPSKRSSMLNAMVIDFRDLHALPATAVFIVCRR